MSNYRKGTRFERELKKQLEENGFFVVRSAGSRGPVDLVAISLLGVVWLIQCKTEGARIKNHTTAKLIEVAGRHPHIIPVYAKKEEDGALKIANLLTHNDLRHILKQKRDGVLYKSPKLMRVRFRLIFQREDDFKAYYCPDIDAITLWLDIWAKDAWKFYKFCYDHALTEMEFETFIVRDLIRTILHELVHWAAETADEDEVEYWISEIDDFIGLDDLIFRASLVRGELFEKKDYNLSE